MRVEIYRLLRVCDKQNAVNIMKYRVKCTRVIFFMIALEQFRVQCEGPPAAHGRLSASSWCNELALLSGLLPTCLNAWATSLLLLVTQMNTRPVTSMILRTKSKMTGQKADRLFHYEIIMTPTNPWTTTLKLQKHINVSMHVPYK